MAQVSDLIRSQSLRERMTTRAITPHSGLEIGGVDLTTLSDADLHDVQQLLDDRLVLVFRDQKLDRDQHKAIARRFGTGEIHRHPLQRDRTDIDTEVSVVETGPQSKITAGNEWHADTTAYLAPVSTSLLYLTQLPPSGGGDTVYINMYRAFDSLSAPMREFVAGLRAVHDATLPWTGMFGFTPKEGQTFPRTSHRVVLTHPRTGRQQLFVNRGFTSHVEDLSKDESRALLDLLFAHAEATLTLQCRVRWEPNTLVMWDNIATQHHAVWDYFPERRYAERISVLGPELEGAIAR
ncbi:TauD/TfdA dioxygenase family protein [Novosphingobium sp. BL-52-GroH]|uniref:TauD/TfdA dioxygenase family protein n=1 Tax=Novosphingobium sp. BL-52-GroH TaxID=3349877 RepID=UPI00384E9ED8